MTHAIGRGAPRSALDTLPEAAHALRMARPLARPVATFDALLSARVARDSRAGDAAIRALARAVDCGRLVADLRTDGRAAKLLDALMWAARECPDRALEIGLILGSITRMAD